MVLGAVVFVSNPSTQEVEAEGSGFEARLGRLFLNKQYIKV